MKNILKWDMRFLEMAKLVASWSHDPSTKTGAVVVDPSGRVVSVGYNGFARGVEDYPERYENRYLKYKLMVHCERNAVIFAQRSVVGCTLYTWPFMSCSPCAAMMIQAGIQHCVAPYSGNERWAEDFRLTTTMFEEAGVDLDVINFSDLTLEHMLHNYTSECGWRTKEDEQLYNQMRSLEVALGE